MSKLGIIGGLGPMATANLSELIIRMTEANTDQEHLETVVLNCPSVPDRTSYILGKSTQNPYPDLLALGKTLESLEVSQIAIPCITAHYFHKELSENINVPIINPIEETCKILKANGVESAGIMATEGTIQSKIFASELEKHNITPIIPDEKHQEIVTSIIYDYVKANKIPRLEDFFLVKTHLYELGAQAVILGCTELHIVKKLYQVGNGVIDVVDVLAFNAITRCGKKVKDKYQVLFERENIQNEVL